MIFRPRNSTDFNVTIETIPGPTTDVFSKLAKEFGVVIILNLYEKDGIETVIFRVEEKVRVGGE